MRSVLSCALHAIESSKAVLISPLRLVVTPRLNRPLFLREVKPNRRLCVFRDVLKERISGGALTVTASLTRPARVFPLELFQQCLISLPSPTHDWSFHAQISPHSCAGISSSVCQLSDFCTTTWSGLGILCFSLLF